MVAPMSWRLRPVCSREASCDQFGLVVEIVRGALRALLALARNQLRDPISYSCRHESGYQPTLMEHDDGSHVDLIEELDRSPAASRGLVQVHGCRLRG